MKILLTNIVMASRSGTEVVTAELAYELRKRGHEIAIYAHTCGQLAETLRFHGLIVVDKIHQVPFTPDIIHGHHNITLAIALTHFPITPAIFVCHDFDIWHDKAFTHPRIYKYVAVDQLCLRRLTIDGIAKQDCCLINNAVVTRKFLAKQTIAVMPKTALLLSKGAAHSDMIQQVCQELQIKLDLIGPAFNHTIDNLHEILRNYDIVFATARMAIEALACGCCVIVCDHRGFAGTVTTQNWANWYDWNLGRGILVEDVSTENLINAIAAYSAPEIARLTETARVDADIERAVDRYELIYQAAISSHQTQAAKIAAAQYSLSAFLEDFLPSYNIHTQWFEVSQKLIGEASIEPLILQDIHAQLAQLQSATQELQELPDAVSNTARLLNQLQTEVNLQFNQLQADVTPLETLQEINATVNQLQQRLNRLRALKPINAKLSQLQARSQAWQGLPEIHTKLDRLQSDTDCVRQDLGFIRLLTRLLRAPYTQIKKIFRS